MITPDIMEHTLLDQERLKSLENISIIIDLECVCGSIVEVGAFRGGSSKFLAKNNPKRKVFVFDTFCGIPCDPGELDTHIKGDFAADYGEVCTYLADCPNITVYSGIFPESMPNNMGPVALAHIDVDMESSVRGCILALWPKVSCGGFLVFDDYNAEACKGLKRAVDEMFGDKIIVGPHPQAWVQKTGVSNNE